MRDPNAVSYRLPLPVYQMSLTVEWARDGDWDQHWALMLLGPDREQYTELARCCTYTEARRLAIKTLRAVMEGQPVT